MGLDECLGNIETTASPEGLRQQTIQALCPAGYTFHLVEEYPYHCNSCNYVNDPACWYSIAPEINDKQLTQVESNGNKS